MDYKKIYNNLIQKRRNFPIFKEKEYCENHHIIPRCMDGSENKNNLVNLSAREHFIAHELLCKIYPKNHSLLFSLWRMFNSNNKRTMLYQFSSKEYEKTKIKFSKMISNIMTGKNNGFKKKYEGHTYEEIHGEEKSKEIKEKKSISMSGENNWQIKMKKEDLESYEKWANETIRGENSSLFGKNRSGKNNPRYIEISNKIQLEICKLYIEGKTFAEITRLIGIKSKPILRILKENKVHIRNATEAAKRKKCSKQRKIECTKCYKLIGSSRIKEHERICKGDKI